MHPSTTAKITATEYINGIFLQIHMFRFFIDLCIHRNASHEYYYFASLGTFMHQGYRMQRLKKSLHIFCMDKRLLEVLFQNVINENTGCHSQLVVVASPEATLYTADSVKVGYWAFGHTKRCNDFPERPPNYSLLLLNSQSPIYLTCCTCVQCMYSIRSRLLNKLNVKISCP